MEESAGPVARASALAGRRLTPTERSIVALVAARPGRPCSKERMAVVLGRSPKTVDRLVSRLRADGVLASEARWGPDGAQLPNAYRLL